MVSYMCMIYYRFTAIALEHLAAGFEPEWQAELYVDVAILNKLAIFLAEHQDQDTGAFWDMCILYDIKTRVCLNMYD